MNKKRMTRTVGAAARAVVLPLVAVLTAGVLPAYGQSPTPEGTTITNTATVSFDDANNNTYADVTASVSLTVGFQGGLDVVRPAASAAPSANTTGNQLAFTIDNDGNGPDTLRINEITVANPTVVTNVTFIYDGTPYPDTASLNAALSTVEVPSGGSITVTVVYDVPAGVGGLTSDVSLGAESLRTGGNTDSDTVSVEPPLGGTITITDPVDANRLPSNGTQYTMQFEVISTLSGTDDVDLSVALDGTNAAGLTIISVGGTAGTTATLTFTAGQTRLVDVVYTVADNAAGSASDITLTATAQTAPNPTDTETGAVTIIKPALTIIKEVFTDALLTNQLNGGDEVLPGQTLYYRVTVSNTGSAAATGVTVTDETPAETNFVAVSTGAGSVTWDTLGGTGTPVVVTGTLATLAPGASAVFVTQLTVK